jgi:hypothetical protein
MLEKMSSVQNGTKTGGSQKYWVLVAPIQYMQSGRIAAQNI